MKCLSIYILVGLSTLFLIDIFLLALIVLSKSKNNDIIQSTEKEGGETE